MGREAALCWPPLAAPAYIGRKDESERFDSSIDAVSFGFVATAVLISMFFAIAIFERFSRPASSYSGRSPGDSESQMGFVAKLPSHPPPNMQVHAGEVSVLLMPGENMPTFIALPTPMTGASS